MRLYTLLFIIMLAGCSRPLYVKDKHFKPVEKENKVDTDLKQLVYKSLEKAFVTEKDIADYRLLWKKDRIYVSNEYQNSKTDYQNREDWNNSLSCLEENQVPSSIGKVKFSLKSREELQKISDKTREDFLHASFSLISIDGDFATISIENSWIVSKHHKKTMYLSGGGYTCTFKKIEGVWIFQRIEKSWIS